MSDQLAQNAGPPRDRWGRYLLPTVDDPDIADACWVAEHCRQAMQRRFGGAE